MPGKVSPFRRLFGDRSRWVLAFSWTATGLSFSAAVVPLVFILFFAFWGKGNGEDLINALRVLSDYRHVQALQNSLILGFLVSITLTVISVSAALFARFLELTGHRLVYAVCIVPLLIPDQVVGVLGRAIVDPSMGALAPILPPGLLLHRFSALMLVWFFTTAKWLPLSIVIADASILSFGLEFLHQIRMDFPRFLQAVKRVFLPNLIPSSLIIASLGFLVGFRQHELAVELTSGGGGFGAETWSAWNFRVLFSFNDFSRAAAEALLVLFVLLIPILLIRRQAMRGVVDE